MFEKVSGMMGAETRGLPNVSKIEQIAGESAVSLRIVHHLKNGIPKNCSVFRLTECPLFNLNVENRNFFFFPA